MSHKFDIWPKVFANEIAELNRFARKGEPRRGGMKGGGEDRKGVAQNGKGRP